MLAYAKPSMLITFILVAFVAMSSVVESRPIGVWQASSNQLDHSTTSAGITGRHSNGLISDILAAVGLLGVSSPVNTQTFPKASLFNSTAISNVTASALAAGKNAGSVSQFNVSTAAINQIETLVQELVNTLSRNLNTALSSIDSLTTLL